MNKRTLAQKKKSIKWEAAAPESFDTDSIPPHVGADVYDYSMTCSCHSKGKIFINDNYLGEFDVPCDCTLKIFSQEFQNTSHMVIFCSKLVPRN